MGAWGKIVGGLSKSAKKIKVPKLTRAPKVPKGKFPTKGGGRFSQFLGEFAGSMMNNGVNSLMNLFNSDKKDSPKPSSFSSNNSGSASSNEPSLDIQLAQGTNKKLDEVVNSALDGDIREAEAKEAEAKKEKDLMSQIVRASESLNRRTQSIIGKYGLEGEIIRDSKGEIVEPTAPRALMTRAQIAKQFEAKNNGDKRMTDLMQLLAANNELLGNIDLRLHLIIRQGTVKPEAELQSAQILKRLAQADKRIEQSLDTKAKKLKEPSKNDNKDLENLANALGHLVGEDVSSSGSGKSVDEKMKSLLKMAGILGFATPVVLQLTEGLFSAVDWIGDSIFGEDEKDYETEGGNNHKGYETVKDFDKLSKEQQKEVVKQEAIDNVKFAATTNGVNAGVLAAKKGYKVVKGKITGKATAQATKTAARSAFLKKLSPKALKIVGKKLMSKVALKAAAKGALKKVPILGAAVGLWGGITRAIRGDWAGAAAEVTSGLMGGTGVGLLGSVAIDAGLIYRDYRKAMKAIEEGDYKTLNMLGITDTDLDEILVEPDKAEMEADDGKSPEDIVGEAKVKKGDAKVAEVENQAQSSIEQTIGSVEKEDKSSNNVYKTAPTSDIQSKKAKPDLPKKANGGWIWGASHENGGVPVELEGGEFVVNEESARENKRLLEAINRSNTSLEALISGQNLQTKDKQTEEVVQVPKDIKLNSSNKYEQFLDAIYLAVGVLRELKSELYFMRRERLMNSYNNRSSRSDNPWIANSAEEIDDYIAGDILDSENLKHYQPESSATETSGIDGTNEQVNDIAKVETIQGINGNVFPVENPVITDVWGSPRSDNRIHKGIDFRGEVGTKVFATRAGIVTLAGHTSGGIGIVSVKDDYGFKHEYLHVVPTVKTGTFVNKGALVATIAPKDKYSTGPHLHYQERDNKGIPFDPMYSLGAEGVNFKHDYQKSKYLNNPDFLARFDGKNDGDLLAEVYRQPVQSNWLPTETSTSKVEMVDARVSNSTEKNFKSSPTVTVERNSQESQGGTINYNPITTNNGGSTYNDNRTYNINNNTNVTSDDAKRAEV